jgi:hypothetical protein
MSDDLRTRIATTLYGDGEELIWTRCLQLADLVLWELGLKPEDSYGTSYPKYPVRVIKYTRHCTDWREE